MAIQSYVVDVSTSQVLIAEAQAAGLMVLLNNIGPDEVYLDGANDEIQNVAFTGGPEGGTFTLTYAGQTTAAIAYDASAADVQAALVALSNLDPGDVVVSDGSGGLPNGFVSVRFTDGLNQPEMTGSGTGLTGGSGPGVDVTTVQAGGVDASDSWALAKDASLSFSMKSDDRLYGICAGGESASVQVMLIG